MLFQSTPIDDLLHPFAAELTKERDKAIEERESSGLDAIWAAARDQYQGIDEVNRSRGYSKSRSLDGPISPLGKVERENRSTVFVNITRPYTDAGTSFLANVLLPSGNQLNWELLPTPVSETAILGQVLQQYPEAQQLIAVMPNLALRLSQTEEERKASIELAKTLISDWMVETNWSSEVRKQINEAGKVGTGVLKGPFPKLRRLSLDVQAVLEGIDMLYEDPAQAELVRNTLNLRLLYQPGMECIPVENIYPDHSCGTEVQNGKQLWERVPDVTKRKLAELLNDKSYFPEQIMACLEEEPIPLKKEGKRDKKSYDLWIRTGEVDLAKLQSRLSGDDSDDSEQDETPEAEEKELAFVQVVMCNDRIIKIDQLPLDDNRFPYTFLLWEPRTDSWAGIGIPEQIETPQRGLNASVRAGNDNMAWSVGPQVLMTEGLIEPVDGDDLNPHPYKRWRVLREQLAGMLGKDVDPKMALQFLEFPNYLQQILPWIDYWLRMAESTTGLSLLLQGQKATDSVGVSSQLMQNQSTNIKLRVRHWDDDVCEPIIQSMYSWVQQYGPDEAKGDAVAHSMGSSILITRELQQQALLQLGDRVVQPVYGISPKKWARLFLQSFQFNPDMLALDEEERAQLEAAANQPDPKVEVANIMAQAQLQVAQLNAQVQQMKTTLDAQLKGMSLDHATDVVDKQMAGQIVTEGMKHDHEMNKETVKQEGAIAKEKMKAPAASAEESAPEPSVDDALDELGIQ